MLRNGCLGVSKGMGDELKVWFEEVGVVMIAVKRGLREIVVVKLLEVCFSFLLCLRMLLLATNHKALHYLQQLFIAHNNICPRAAVRNNFPCEIC